MVNNGSHDDTVQILIDFKRNGILNLSWVDNNSKGITHGLNNALKISQGKIAIFINDDHIVSPDCLVNHLRHQATSPSCIVGNLEQVVHTHVFTPVGNSVLGVTAAPFLTANDLDDFSGLNKLSYDDGKKSTSIWHYFESYNILNPSPWKYFGDGNVSIARDVLIGLGGFYEGYGSWSLNRQDLAFYDIALRIKNAGCPLSFEQNAIVLRQISPKKVVNHEEEKHSLNCLLSRHTDLNPSLIRSLSRS